MALIAQLYNSIALKISDNTSHGFIKKYISGDTFVYVDITTESEYTIKLDHVMCPVQGQKDFEDAKQCAKSAINTSRSSNKDRVLVKVKVNRIENEIYYAELKYPVKNRDGKCKYKYLQATLVSNGYAFVLDPVHDVSLTALQSQAKGQEIGVWKSKKVVYPWNFHKKKDEMNKLQVLLDE